MKLVTASQMRHIDQVTIEDRGVPGATLMDRAGKAIARETLECFEPESVAVLTGKGNNAGDGFVAARELARMGIKVVIYMLSCPDELSGDALGAYEKLPEDLERILQPSPAILREQLIHYDLVIDAIFGTGLNGPVREPWDAIIEAVNACRVNVLSADIPSGLPGDPHAEVGPHIHATMTVTMGTPKLTMVTDPGVRSTGRVIIADLGFPRDLLEDASITTNLLTTDSIQQMLPPRPPDGHKGTFGKVMLVGGSRGLTGAAILASRAACRSGAGLVFTCFPEPLAPAFEINLIEPIKIPLPGDEPFFTAQHVERVLRETANMQAVAIGPGLGRHPETKDFMLATLREVNAPVVIDADGLNLLAEGVEELAQRPGPTVLTPHPVEAARLLGCSKEDVIANRIDAFRELSARYRAVVVLKGSQTVITDPDGQCYINPTGNTGLAKGGSGDVLTGLIAGLLAQGATPRHAACLGVFLHGMAADVCAEQTSVRAMLPGEVIDSLSTAFRRLETTG